MRPLEFLRSPKGNLLLLLTFVAVATAVILRGRAHQGTDQTQLASGALAPGEGRQSIVRESAPFRLPAALLGSIRKSEPKHDTPSERDRSSPSVRPLAPGASPTPPRALPISLLVGTAESLGAPTRRYAPYGRLIPCETVVALESSRLDTPVIGLVTEDVWHNGELIIPAGVEVHGRASVDRSRERIAAAGKWVLVWRDGSPLNGTELVLNGIALERELDAANGNFGLQDGSSGLRGTLVKTDDWQEIKLFASTFLSGMATGLQEVRNQGGALGELAQVPLASGRNAALQGTADVLNAYARQIQETIARDGFFVRVPARKQFYLYVTETIDQAKGARGNVANADLWRKSP